MSVTPTEDRASFCAAPDSAQIREKWTKQIRDWDLGSGIRDQGSGSHDYLAARVASLDVPDRIGGIGE